MDTCYESTLLLQDSRGMWTLKVLFIVGVQFQTDVRKTVKVAQWENREFSIEVNNPRGSMYMI